MPVARIRQGRAGDFGSRKRRPDALAATAQRHLPVVLSLRQRQGKGQCRPPVAAKVFLLDLTESLTEIKICITISPSASKKSSLGMECRLEPFGEDAFTEQAHDSSLLSLPQAALHYSR